MVSGEVLKFNKDLRRKKILGGLFAKNMPFLAVVSQLRLQILQTLLIELA